MKHISGFALLISLLSATPSPLHAGTAQKRGEGRLRPVRVSIVNMSGKSREASIHRFTVTLPVAKPVPLLAYPGDVILITSNTDQKVSNPIVVSAFSDGRFYPVD